MHKYRFEKGMVQVYTGDGKGKTSAALGIGLRATGQGFKVYLIQFMKGNINYGELTAVARLKPDFTIRQMGRESFVSKENPDPVDVEWAQKGIKLAHEIIARGEHDVVILDEISVALDYKLVTLEQVLDLIKRRPSHVELILTGRNAHPEVLALADLVTEMREVKHYYRAGVTSRRGIDL